MHTVLPSLKTHIRIALCYECSIRVVLTAHLTALLEYFNLIASFKYLSSFVLPLWNHYRFSQLYCPVPIYILCTFVMPNQESMVFLLPIYKVKNIWNPKTLKGTPDSNKTVRCCRNDFDFLTCLVTTTVLEYGSSVPQCHTHTPQGSYCA